jgi:hypothetical protein
LSWEEKMNFGDYTWRVLKVENSRALVITETIIELRWYHTKFEDVTWADCALRKYLNSEFYDSFKQTEKEKILEVTCKNPDNPWFGTKGGQDTVDKIFLLGLGEVSEYFGDSKTNLHNKGKQTWMIDDQHNSERQAKYGDDFHWWRLRSPGYYSRTAASISSNGTIYVRGNGVHGRPKDSGGIRPALWIKDDSIVQLQNQTVQGKH